MLILALLLQTEILHGITFRGAAVSLVLVVVVYESLRRPMLGAVVVGLVAGACEDALSAQTGGAWTISTTLTALAVNLLGRWFFADSPFAVSVVAVVATLLRRLIFWVVMALQGYPPGYARIHLHAALWEALLNAVAAAAILAAVRFIGERRTT